MARFAHLPAVFFDIDDTLYDFHGSIRRTLARLRGDFPEPLGAMALEAVEARYWAANATLTDDEKLALIDRDPFLYRRATWLLFLAREEAGLGPEERAPPSLKARFFADSASVGPAGDGDDLASRLAASFGRLRFDNLRDSAYPRALDTVRELRALGRRVGIISNGPSPLQRAKFRALALEGVVPERHVMISGEFGERKPHPSIFETAAARVGVSPHESVFIGDSVECDVPSKATGMTFIFFNAQRRPLPDFKTACGHEPDAVAHTYDEVRALLGLS